MSIRNIAVGHPRDTLKAALAEFFSTMIFVFAGKGSRMAFNEFTDDGSTMHAGLFTVALVHSFGLFIVVSVGANISGGHINLAITFGAFLGENITLFHGILYWVAQLLGSTAAYLLLKYGTVGLFFP